MDEHSFKLSPPFLNKRSFALSVFGMMMTAGLISIALDPQEFISEKHEPPIVNAKERSMQVVTDSEDIVHLLANQRVKAVRIDDGIVTEVVFANGVKLSGGLLVEKP